MIADVSSECLKAKAVTLLRWKASEAKTLAICIALAIVCGTLSLTYVQKILDLYNTEPSKAFGDFFALWSYAKIASLHPAAELYDFSALHAQQVALGMMPGDQNPFPYPPTAIFLLLPLSLFPYKIAYIIWVAATFALFLWAVVGTCWRSPGIVLPVLIAPTTTLAIASGQSGFLSGALLIGGIRLAANRPVVAGILLGILSYKPQLGLLVPVALASAGLWRTLGTACATVIGLAIFATVSFGWSVWPAWIDMLPTYAQWFGKSDQILKFMPTVEANLRIVGIGPTVAEFTQITVAIVVATVIWRNFRTGPTESATAALLTATFLCTPHALIYDAPMLIGALALFINSRLRADATFSLAEIVIMLLVLAFPFLMTLKGFNIPVSSLSLLLMLRIIVVRRHSIHHPAWHSALSRGWLDMIRIHKSPLADRR